jgi:hypothetical protein
MCVISREDSKGFDSRFRAIGRIGHPAKGTEGSSSLDPASTTIRSGTIHVSGWLRCSKGESCTVHCTQSYSPSRTQNFRFSPAAAYTESPYSATFVVNSEPRTGARPSVRLCVGRINSETHTGARPLVRVCVGSGLSRCVH